MNKNLLYKVLGVLFLTLVMSWALNYVNSLILERQARQNEVINQIAKSSSGRQTLVGPVLVIPYTLNYPQTYIENNVDKITIRHEENKIYIYPEELQLSGGFTNEFKYIGIYKALMYQMGGSVSGKFKIPANLGIKSEHANSTYTIHDVYLSIGITDTRGIIGKPTLNWNQTSIDFEQGSQLPSLGNGIHAALSAISLEEQHIPFDFKLNLGGMESFDIVPIANMNKVTLQSSWPHPSFSGSFLPIAANQKIDDQGFSANWAISSLSGNVQEKLSSQLASQSQQGLDSISVGFVEPINIYSQSDRATKYGMLFIGLTFAGFFIFEILKRLPIHPAQYTLVGLAMALFYLLLISLSEHMSFIWSYLIASLACITLLAYYLSYVLKSKTHGLVFAGLLTALYGALYGILASEDNALLMGSLLVFGLLALGMIATRKVDWYQIGLPVH
jgi:inner membrane protein